MPQRALPFFHDIGPVFQWIEKGLYDNWQPWKATPDYLRTG